jgi:hypothetical protein
MKLHANVSAFPLPDHGYKRQKRVLKAAVV